MELKDISLKQKDYVGCVDRIHMELKARMRCPALTTLSTTYRIHMELKVHGVHARNGPQNRRGIESIWN